MAPTTDDTDDTVDASGAETLDAPPGLASAGLRSRSLEGDRVFAQVAAGLFQADAEAPRIGDYFVLEKLGAGGMGAVFTAYDPTLDRKVAVKVLHGGAADSTIGQQRLIREARALARLNHPNVVTVHGAGAYEKGAYVAMEFVEGQDLARWLDRDPRPWEEVLDIFLQAARGLEAAHAAGIVHRDFKPGNVLVGDDGVVRVADFGLARPTEGAAMDEHEADTASASSLGQSSWGSGADKLTRTHGVVGTPKYMAPEQYIGSEVGPAADQYSFCLSLYEGLYGELPFKGKTIAQLATAKSLGDLERPTAGSVPSWLFRLVSRGLQPRVEDRWASMSLIVQEIETRQRGRRGWLLGLGGTVALAAIAGAVWVGTRPEPTVTPVDPCADLERELEGTWTEQQREQSRDAFLATELPYAEASWATAARRLDATRTSWLDSREQACREFQAQRESEALYDRRQDCLRAARRRLDLVAASMIAADASTVEHVDALLDELPPLGRCQAPSKLLDQYIRPPEASARERGDSVVDEVHRLRVASRTGDVETRDRLLERLRPQADDEGLESWARGEVARALASFTQDPAERGRLLELAVHHGLACRNDQLAVYALFDLAMHQSALQQRPKALLTIQFALALLERMAGYSQGFEGLMGVVNSARPHGLQIRGTTLNEMGRTDEGIAALETSIELWQAHKDEHPVLYLNAINNLAEALRTRGDYSRAIELYSSGIELIAGRFGEQHPTLGTVYNNRASAKIEQGSLSDGVEDLKTARALEVAHGGENQMVVGIIDYNRAMVAIARGELDQARGHIDTAEKAWTATVGPGHPFMALAGAARATALRVEGKPEQAIPLLDTAETQLRAIFKQTPHLFVGTVLGERAAVECALGHATECEKRARAALGSFEGSTGLDNTAAANVRSYLGDALAMQPGKRDEAEKAYRTSIAVLEERGSKTHPDLSHPLNGLASLLIAAGESEVARPLLERNLSLQEAEGIPPYEFERTRELLAALE